MTERLADRIAQASQGAPNRILRELLRLGAIDPHVAALSREAAQPAVRALALQILVEGRARWPDGFERQWIDKSMGLMRRVVRYGERPIARAQALEDLLAQGAGDRSTAVRRVAADGFVKYRHSLKNGEDLLERFAADRSPAIRERAAFVQRERHGRSETN